MIFELVFPLFIRLRKSHSSFGGGPYHSLEEDVSSQYRRMKDISYVWENGELSRIWRDNRNVFSAPVLYVHLQKRKMEFPSWLDVSNGFVIQPNRFLELKINGCTLLTRLHQNKALKDSYLRLRYLCSCIYHIWLIRG